MHLLGKASLFVLFSLPRKDLEEQELVYLTREEAIAAIRNGEIRLSGALAAFSLVLGGILPAR